MSVSRLTWHITYNRRHMQGGGGGGGGICIGVDGLGIDYPIVHSCSKVMGFFFAMSKSGS